MQKAFTFLLLLISCSGFAQITNSNISGTVKTKAGEKIAGSTITFLFKEQGLKYTASSDKNGYYQIYNANVGGPYTVMVSAVGHKDYEKSNIILELGSNTVDILLEEAVVTLQDVVVKSNKTVKNAAVVLGEQRINSVPAMNRSLPDYTKLTPQSNNNSFAGTNFRYNNVTVDGTINNDAIGFSPSLGGQSGTSGMPGASTRTSPISADAIQDIQVFLAPFDVKIGNFLGGSINAVTRSGSNEVKGSVYSFGRNQHLTGNKSLGKMSDNQTGFRVGFPLIKDKLFFFTSEEMTKRVEPTVYNANGNGLINDSLARVISNFVQSKYGFNVGEYDNYSINSKSVKFFNRIDWNINEHHQLTLRNNTVFSEATNLERDAANFRFSSMDFTQKNNQNSTVMELRSRFGKRSNSLIVGYSDIHDYRMPSSGNAAFPQTEIAYNGGTIFLGNEREATVFNMKQKTTELTDNFNFTVGKHNLLIGTHNEFYNIAYGFVNSWNGRIAYKSVNDFLNSNVNRVRGFYSFNNNTRDYLFNNPYATYKVNLLSTYIQDEINFGKLKLTPGIRFDYTDLPVKPALSAQAPTTFTNTYFNNGQISPRLGFTFKATNTLTFRGGTGKFVGRIPFAWIGYAYYNDGVGFGSFDVNNIAGKNKGDVLSSDAKTFAFANGQPNLTQIDLISNGFKMPSVWRSNLAVEKTIKGYKLVGEVLYTQVINDLQFQQINFKTDAANYGFFSYDVNREMPIYNGAKINSNLSNAYSLSNTQLGYRYSYTVSVNKKYPFNLEVFGAYTYGVSKDITNGIRNSMESNWQLNQSLTPNAPSLAYSNFDVRNRFVASAVYKYKKSQLSAYFNSVSGSPFTWGIVNGTVAGTPQAAGLVYIFKDLAQAQKYIPAAGQAQAFMDFVESVPYLASRKGQFTERNGGRTPWSTTMDLRFLQNIGKRFQFTVDIFNFTNMLNANWGKIYFVSNTFNSTASVGLAKTAGSFSTSGVLTDAQFSFSKPTQSPYSIDNINSRWQMQVGLRYSFSSSKSK